MTLRRYEAPTAGAQGDGSSADRARSVRRRALAVLALGFLLGSCGFARSDSGEDAGSQTGYGRAAPYSSLPVYQGVAWADGLQEEQDQYLGHLREAEIGGYQADDYAGQFVNVTGDERRTVDPAGGDPPVRLWLTGGSAAFGLGQRDAHTVASHLVRLAENDGVTLAVTNLGVPGRTLWNEFQDAQRRLSEHPEERPDLLVSYGGFNDAVGSLATISVGREDVAAPNVLDNDAFETWRQQGFALPDGVSIDQVADLTVDRYRRVQDQFDELGSEHGIEIEYVFQPDALAAPQQFESVAGVWSRVPVEIAGTLGAQLEAVSRGLGDSIWNLRHLHDEEDASLFVDWAHAGERGAELVALALYDLMAPHLAGPSGEAG